MVNIKKAVHSFCAHTRKRLHLLYCKLQEAFKNVSALQKPALVATAKKLFGIVIVGIIGLLLGNETRPTIVAIATSIAALLLDIAFDIVHWLICSRP